MPSAVCSSATKPAEPVRRRGRNPPAGGSGRPASRQRRALGSAHSFGASAPFVDVPEPCFGSKPRGPVECDSAIPQPRRILSIRSMPSSGTGKRVSCAIRQTDAIPVRSSANEPTASAGDSDLSSVPSWIRSLSCSSPFRLRSGRRRKRSPRNSGRCNGLRGQRDSKNLSSAITSSARIRPKGPSE